MTDREKPLDKLEEWELLSDALIDLLAVAMDRHSYKYELRDDTWLDQECRYHVYKAHDELSLASFHARRPNKKGIFNERLADALNHILMAVVTYDPETKEGRCQ